MGLAADWRGEKDSVNLKTDQKSSQSREQRENTVDS